MLNNRPEWIPFGTGEYRKTITNVGDGSGFIYFKRMVFAFVYIDVDHDLLLLQNKNIGNKGHLVFTQAPLHSKRQSPGSSMQSQGTTGLSAP